MFQFLLVQLKEQADTIAASSSGISIPSGSIKRRMGFRIQHPSHISIPSGSIKSSAGAASNRTIAIFQFLLVQLKVLLIFLFDMAIVEFQFLLVQLKEQNVLRLVNETLFQFLLVQLKDTKEASGRHS